MKNTDDIRFLNSVFDFHMNVQNSKISSDRLNEYTSYISLNRHAIIELAEKTGNDDLFFKLFTQQTSHAVSINKFFAHLIDREFNLSKYPLDNSINDQPLDGDNFNYIHVDPIKFRSLKLGRFHNSIKQSFIGAFYSRHIKKNNLFRSLFLWAWNISLICYNKYLLINGKIIVSRSFKIIDIDSFLTEIKCSKKEIFKDCFVHVARPKFYPANSEYMSSIEKTGYSFPSCFISEINEALIFGKSNLVFIKKMACINSLVDLSRDTLAEEFHHIFKINVKKREIKVIFPYSMPMEIPEAAQFVDSCSSNYAHWLTEVLPRIALFCSQDEYNKIPIIVDAFTHKNYSESLKFIVGNDRPIIQVSNHVAIKVKKLYHVSTVGYVPFDFRCSVDMPPEQGKFSPGALNLMVAACTKYALKDELMPKKVYIRRNSYNKYVLNQLSVELFLVKQGFYIIQPEEMDFLKQIEIFRNADIVVGTSGAAMANLIFSSNNTKIVILIGDSKRVSYYYWQNIARAVGLSVSYVLGRVPASQQGNNQPDFLINLADLSRALETTY